MNARCLTSRPTLEDIDGIYGLISGSELNLNSRYCYLLQCSHFSETCLVAREGGEIVGWVGGYLRPDREANLFIWQICVSDAVRNQGVGLQMLLDLCERVGRVDCLEATVTKPNLASFRMFEKFATHHEVGLHSKLVFDSLRHLGGSEESEYLLTINMNQNGTVMNFVLEAMLMERRIIAWLSRKKYWISCWLAAIRRICLAMNARRARRIDVTERRKRRY